MNLEQLINLARTRLDDLETPYLVSDEDFTLYADEGEMETARRARLLVDSTTPAVTQLAATANSWQYALDPRVIFVKRARFAANPMPLRKISYRDLDKMVPGWEDHAAGTPYLYCTDFQSGKLIVYPKLASADTLKLTVVREPLAPIEQSATETPEIAARHHYGLVNWMLYRAYDRNDPDVRDPKKSLEYLALFEAEFGPRSTAQDETWINEQDDFADYSGVY